MSVVRVGQPLQLRNGDRLTHNVHSLSLTTPFNLPQVAEAPPFLVTPRAEERMLQLKCNVHCWMTALVAAVNHPYFAVSDAAGRFSVQAVPPGSYAVRAWHQRFGLSTP